MAVHGGLFSNAPGCDVIIMLVRGGSRGAMQRQALHRHGRRCRRCGSGCFLCYALVDDGIDLLHVRQAQKLPHRQLPRRFEEQRQRQRRARAAAAVAAVGVLGST